MCVHVCVCILRSLTLTESFGGSLSTTTPIVIPVSFNVSILNLCNYARYLDHLTFLHPLIHFRLASTIGAAVSISKIYSGQLHAVFVAHRTKSLMKTKCMHTNTCTHACTHSRTHACMYKHTHTPSSFPVVLWVLSEHSTCLEKGFVPVFLEALLSPSSGSDRSRGFKNQYV